MSFGSTNDKLNNTQDYGSTHFIGKVIVNKDPDGLDRIKAIVPGLYETLESCPWIGPFKISPFGVGSGYGTYGPPQINSDVLIILQEGNPSYPAYVGHLLKKGNKTDADFHEQCWGFVDPSGNKFIVDMREHTLKFIHSTGMSFEILANGSLNIYVPKDVEWNIGGSFTLQARGPIRIASEDNVYIEGREVHWNG